MNVSKISHHAWVRMREFGFSEAEVLNAVGNSVMSTPGRFGCREFWGTRLIATVAQDGTVVTVKPQTPEPYQHAS
jgi:hypothetical protein